MTRPPERPLSLAPPDVERRALPGGGLVLRSRRELGPYPRCLGDLLAGAAAAVPERLFLAERAPGGWRRLTYGAALQAVERLAGALLDRGLGEERPVAILSDNGIDNALLQLAAMHAGIPVAPVSPAYSLQSRDHAKLRTVLGQLRPGLIYAEDGAAYEAALAVAAAAATWTHTAPWSHPAPLAHPTSAARVVAPAVGAACGVGGAMARGGVPEIVVGINPPRQAASGLGAAGRAAATAFDELLASPSGAAVAARFAAVGPDTVAKILFTSGSTGVPKGVVNTQRMLCSNQEAIALGWPFLAERPPVIVDWLPWSHTFGGNHNFNMILRHRGTLYIDRGKPAPGAIETTVRNLREVPSTLHFNVPRAYDMLLPHLERDAALRDCFFGDLDAIFYAAAALPQHVWEKLERLAVAAAGRRITMLSGWGLTETAPSATQVHFPIERAGVIGTPVPGTEIKLAPVGDKLEIRVRGPNVTPGYWRHPADAAEIAAAAFDDEGFLRTGDAGRLADPLDPSRGLLFEGRIAENFKLTSGTWVHTGELRVQLIAACAPVVQDLVLTGHDRESIGLLVFPNPAGCRSLCPEAPDDAPLAELVRHPAVHAALRASLAAHNAANPATSRRVAGALLLAEPPSIDAGEITDKGYINQRAVLDRRAALVERLHADPAEPASGADPDLIRP